MKRSVWTLAAATILLATMTSHGRISAAGDQAEKDGRGQAVRGVAKRNRTNNRYIVRMADLPVSSYEGNIRPMLATKPGRGQKVDRDSAAVIGYAGYLDNRHDEALGRVGGGRKLYDYRYTFNGFTAEITDTQADALQSVNGVLSVTKDELQHADTSSTPTFLGLTGRDGLWNKLGGVDEAGEDIIIGVIDSGIWPESQSFSDRVPSDKDDDHGWDWNSRDSWKRGHDWGDGPLLFHHTPRWKGTCETGEAFRKSDCNRKLIGARHFNEAWGGDAGVKEERALGIRVTA